MIMKEYIKMFAIVMLSALLCTLAALAILPLIKMFDNIVIAFLAVLPIITLASMGITALLNIAIDKFF